MNWITLNNKMNDHVCRYHGNVQIRTMVLEYAGKKPQVLTLCEVCVHALVVKRFLKSATFMPGFFDPIKKNLVEAADNKNTLRRPA